MKIYIDSSDIKEIKEINRTSLVDGITTNPSLIAKQNKDIKTILKEICKEIKGPVSAEVTAEDCAGMLKEAKVLKKIAKNIVIKLPLTYEGLRACSELSKKKVKTNVTLCFSVTQALMAAKCGATFVSPFIGRLDDIGENGANLIKDIRKVFDNYKYLKTEILSASIRNIDHVKDVAKAGSDIATIPAKVFHEMYKHELTDKGLKIFLDDWKSTSQKIS
jgi:transaldolase